eukprot:gb/GECH01010932.1/.p1 GENE.gb/GECH01010932.1/~~gb/GECH01010932.1/.p1  ORF type:complete len:1086 (+),score=215.95 gb/GECH01010932.1/:1-3258(+)
MKPLSFCLIFLFVLTLISFVEGAYWTSQDLDSALQSGQTDIHDNEIESLLNSTEYFVIYINFENPDFTITQENITFDSVVFHLEETTSLEFRGENTKIENSYIISRKGSIISNSPDMTIYNNTFKKDVTSSKYLVAIRANWGDIEKYNAPAQLTIESCTFGSLTDRCFHLGSRTNANIFVLNSDLSCQNGFLLQASSLDTKLDTTLKMEGNIGQLERSLLTWNHENANFNDSLIMIDNNITSSWSGVNPIVKIFDEPDNSYNSDTDVVFLDNEIMGSSERIVSVDTKGSLEARRNHFSSGSINQYIVWLNVDQRVEFHKNILNSLNPNLNYGVKFMSKEKVFATNNTVSGVKYTSFSFSTPEVDFFHNFASGSDGVQISQTEEIQRALRIQDNTLVGENGCKGINIMVNVHNIHVEGNIIKGYEYGIFTYSEGVRLENNTISECEKAIYLRYSDQDLGSDTTEIYNNQIWNNLNGITLEWSFGDLRTESNTFHLITGSAFETVDYNSPFSDIEVSQVEMNTNCFVDVGKAILVDSEHFIFQGADNWFGAKSGPSGSRYNGTGAIIDNPFGNISFTDFISDMPKNEECQPLLYPHFSLNSINFTAETNVTIYWESSSVINPEINVSLKEISSINDNDNNNMTDTRDILFSGLLNETSKILPLDSKTNYSLIITNTELAWIQNVSISFNIEDLVFDESSSSEEYSYSSSESSLIDSEDSLSSSVSSISSSSEENENSSFSDSVSSEESSEFSSSSESSQSEPSLPYFNALFLNRSKYILPGEDFVLDANIQVNNETIFYTEKWSPPNISIHWKLIDSDNNSLEQLNEYIEKDEEIPLHIKVPWSAFKKLRVLNSFRAEIILINERNDSFIDIFESKEFILIDDRILEGCMVEPNEGKMISTVFNISFSMKFDFDFELVIQYLPNNSLMEKKTTRNIPITITRNQRYFTFPFMKKQESVTLLAKFFIYLDDKNDSFNIVKRSNISLKQPCRSDETECIQNIRDVINPEGKNSSSQSDEEFVKNQLSNIEFEDYLSENDEGNKKHKEVRKTVASSITKRFSSQNAKLELKDASNVFILVDSICQPEFLS